MNLLIVDDDPTNRKLLRAQLEAEDHSVMAATNGVEALQVLGREAVDAVISDILMPDMDGFRLCLEIRKSARFSTLPVILYTSTYSSPEDRRLAQNAGADGYIVKPAPPQAIFAALHEAMKRSRDSMRSPPKRDETYVLKQYSEALVRKLEEKNRELQKALGDLQVAHRAIVEFNRGLESRVEQRTTELQTANRELESFSSSVSHDLRAPLRAVGGFAAILRRDHAAAIAPDATRLLERIENNVRGMQMLIDNLLEFARLGRKAMSMQRLNFAQLARESLDELAHEQQGRHVEIVIGEIPPCNGDRMLMKQVLTNLLSNALKYTRKREVSRIEVGSERRGGRDILYVRDNGVGFNMRYAGKLFEMFQRLHPQSEFSGSGIGLAIVKRVIEKHGGQVWAEAKPEKGATFYIALPGGTPEPACESA
jgi:signal transduction histidine kinase